MQTRYSTGIEQRFDMLSKSMERRQGDALEQGHVVFRELERRLDEVAARLDQRRSMPAFDSGGIMNAIDARFERAGGRLESSRRDSGSDDAIRGIWKRGSRDISARLESSSAQFAGVDPELIRSLEAQVAGLSRHLARPSAPLPEFEDIGPRLDEIEKSIAGSRETILEAARQAAENAVRSLRRLDRSNSAAVAGLAEDLKSLEESDPPFR